MQKTSELIETFQKADYTATEMYNLLADDLIDVVGRDQAIAAQAVTRYFEEMIKDVLYPVIQALRAGRE